MKNENYSKGKNGEQLALDFLIKKDYILKDKNFRTNWGEIDLIMGNNDTLIFVEVKLKIGNRFGNPEEMISRGKVSQIKRMAQYYIATKKAELLKFKKYRIDAVCIVLDMNNSLERISHYQNIEK